MPSGLLYLGTALLLLLLPIFVNNLDDVVEFCIRLHGHVMNSDGNCWSDARFTGDGLKKSMKEKRSI